MPVVRENNSLYFIYFTLQCQQLGNNYDAIEPIKVYQFDVFTYVRKNYNLIITCFREHSLYPEQRTAIH